VSSSEILNVCGICLSSENSTRRQT